MWSDLLRNSEHSNIPPWNDLYWVFRVITMLIIHCSLITNQPTLALLLALLSFSLHVRACESERYKRALVKLERKINRHFSSSQQESNDQNKRTNEKFTIRLDGRQNSEMKLKLLKTVKIAHLSNWTNEIGQRTCFNGNFPKCLPLVHLLRRFFFSLHVLLKGCGLTERILFTSKACFAFMSVQFSFDLFSFFSMARNLIQNTSLRHPLLSQHESSFENQSIPVLLQYTYFY